MKERKPASPTAVSKTARKERSAQSWVRGKERRRKRAEAQEAAHRVNRSLDSSPWQEACEARRENHRQDQISGRWQPVERNPAGYIRRSDGTRTWWEDPGAKERKHYLETVKQ